MPYYVVETFTEYPFAALEVKAESSIKEELPIKSIGL